MRVKSCPQIILNQIDKETIDRFFDLMGAICKVIDFDCDHCPFYAFCQFEGDDKDYLENFCESFYRLERPGNKKINFIYDEEG